MAFPAVPLVSERVSRVSALALPARASFLAEPLTACCCEGLTRFESAHRCHRAVIRPSASAQSVTVQYSTVLLSFRRSPPCLKTVPVQQRAARQTPVCAVHELHCGLLHNPFSATAELVVSHFAFRISHIAYSTRRRCSVGSRSRQTVRGSKLQARRQDLADSEPRGARRVGPCFLPGPEAGAAQPSQAKPSQVSQPASQPASPRLPPAHHAAANAALCHSSIATYEPLCTYTAPLRPLFRSRPRSPVLVASIHSHTALPFPLATRSPVPHP